MAAQLTERKRVKIRRPTCDDPIYIRWLQNDGGYSYWLFEQRKTLSFRTSNEQRFDPFIEDIEVAPSVTIVKRKEAENRVFLFADNLTYDEVLGMRGLLESIQVSGLVNVDTWKSEGAKWQDVFVDTGTYELGDMDRNLYIISFNISLQKNLGITR